MLRILVSIIIITIAGYAASQAPNAAAQSQSPAESRPPAIGGSAENQSERIRLLASDLADREVQNAVLIQRVRELQAELKALQSDNGIIRQATADLDQSLKLLEQRLGMPAPPR